MLCREIQCVTDPLFRSVYPWTPMILPACCISCGHIWKRGEKDGKQSVISPQQAASVHEQISCETFVVQYLNIAHILHLEFYFNQIRVCVGWEWRDNQRGFHEFYVLCSVLMNLVHLGIKRLLLVTSNLGITALTPTRVGDFGTVENPKWI